MQTELSVEIDRPIGLVFECTNEHVTEWSVTCVSEEVLTETPERVGTTFRMTTQDRGNEMEFQGVVTYFDPPNASAVHLEGQYFDLDVGYRFEDLGGGTRVTQSSRVRGKGLFKVLFGLMGWAMKSAGCRAQRTELDGLKKFCEARGV